MNPFRFQRQDGSSSATARAVGVAAMLLVGLLAYLSANPEAHERFHHDAGHSDHHCVVTEFAAGEAFYIAPVLTLRPTLAVLFETAPAEAEDFLREPVAYVLQPICGPPGRGQNA